MQNPAQITLDVTSKPLVPKPHPCIQYCKLYPWIVISIRVVRHWKLFCGETFLQVASPFRGRFCIWKANNLSLSIPYSFLFPWPDPIPNWSSDACMNPATSAKDIPTSRSAVLWANSSALAFPGKTEVQVCTVNAVSLQAVLLNLSESLHVMQGVLFLCG